MKHPARVCPKGVFTDGTETFPVECDHCDKGGVGLILFGDQEVSIEGAYAFVCAECLKEASVTLETQR